MKNVHSLTRGVLAFVVITCCLVVCSCSDSPDDPEVTRVARLVQSAKAASQQVALGSPYLNNVRGVTEAAAQAEILFSQRSYRAAEDWANQALALAEKAVAAVRTLNEPTVDRYWMLVDSAKMLNARKHASTNLNSAQMHKSRYDDLKLAKPDFARQELSLAIDDLRRAIMRSAVLEKRPSPTGKSSDNLPKELMEDW